MNRDINFAINLPRVFSNAKNSDSEKWIRINQLNYSDHILQKFLFFSCFMFVNLSECVSDGTRFGELGAHTNTHIRCFNYLILFFSI